MARTNRIPLAIGDVGADYCLKVPIVELRNEAEPALRWRCFVGENLSASYQLLKDFVKLASLDRVTASEDVLVFARKWGPLRIKSTGKMATHFPIVRTEDGFALLERARMFGEAGPLEKDEEGHWCATEPLTAWLFYARKASATLRIIKAVKQDKPVDNQLWADALGMQRGITVTIPGVRIVDDNCPEGHRPDTRDFASGVRVSLPKSREKELCRKGITVLITDWLRSVPLYPRMTWAVDAPAHLTVDGNFDQEILELFHFNCVEHRHINLSALADVFMHEEVEVIGVYQAVGLLLAQAACGDPRVMWCDHCYCPYFRDFKMPKPGEKNYCLGCREPANREDSKLRMRQKRAVKGGE